MSILFNRNSSKIIEELDSLTLNEVNQFLQLSTPHQIDLILKQWVKTIKLSVLDGLANGWSARAKQFMAGSRSNNLLGVDRVFFFEVTEKGDKEGVFLEVWENNSGKEEIKLSRGVHQLSRDKGMFIHHRYGLFAPVQRRKDRVVEITEEQYFELKHSDKKGHKK